MPSKPDKLVLRWALFAYLGVILCPIRYFAPSNILDNTWLFALNYAAARHLVMGRDIVWTWGPLAYFLFPFDIGNNLAQGLAFQTALWVLLLLILWDLFDSGFPLRNLAVFSIFVALSSPDYHQAVYPGNLLLCGALILLVHFRLRGGMIRYVTALVMMGLIPLIQVVGAMVVVGVVAGLIVDRILQERRTALLEVTLALIVPTVVAVVGCRLALGSVQAIAAYVRTSLEFAGNYSVVMSIAGPRKQLVAGLEAVALLASAVFVLLTQDREKARFITLILAIPLVIGARHGLVRQDMAHLVQFFCFLALLLAFVTLATPLNGNFTRIGVAVVFRTSMRFFCFFFFFFFFWSAFRFGGGGGGGGGGTVLSLGSVMSIDRGAEHASRRQNSQRPPAIPVQDHLLAQLEPTLIRAHFLDQAGAVEPHDLRQPVRDPRTAVAHIEIDPVQGGRLDPHEDLARASHRHGPFANGHNLIAAVARDEDCFHVSFLLPDLGRVDATRSRRPLSGLAHSALTSSGTAVNRSATRP